MSRILDYAGRLVIGAIPMLVVIVLIGSVAFAVALLRDRASKPQATVPVPILLVRDQSAGIECLTLPAETLFQFDSSDLDEKTGRPLLETHVTRFKAADVRQIVVIGHADRIGARSAIDERSQQRAHTVRNALIKAGIDPRIIVALGVGNRLPVTGAKCGDRDDAAAKACLAPDRRVEIWTRSLNVPREASAPR